MQPNYSIVLSALLQGATTVAVGQVMIPDVSGAYFVVATTAARAGRRSEGIALTAYSSAGVGSVMLQTAGTVDASIVGLGNVSGYARCSATGAIEVFTPIVGGTSDVIGYVDNGRLHLEFGTLTETIIVGSGAGGASLSGTTNGVLSLSAPNTGTADTYWQRPADGVLATNYVDNGILDIGHITVIGNGETYAGASKPLDGFLRFSTQIADGPTHGSSLLIAAYQSTTLGTDPGILGISGGRPFLGDPTHLTEVDVFGDGVFIDAGPGGAGGPYTTFSGEVRIQCKTPTSAGGFSVSNFSFHSGGPATGVASFANGSPTRLRTSLGTGLQVLRTNAGATDIEWATIAATSPGGSSTQLQYNNSGAFGGTTNVTFDGTGLAIGASGYIKYGASPALSGATRHANGDQVVFRNAAASADVVALHGDSSNNLSVGGTQGLGSQFSGLHLQAANDLDFYVGAGNVGVWTSSALSVLGEVHASGGYAGYAAGSAPFGLKAATITQNSNTDITMTAAQYECGKIIINGTATGAWNLIAPNSSIAAFYMFNNSGQSMVVKKPAGSGSTYTAGVNRWCMHDGNDYRVTN